ncbi:unnamed protein product [Rhizophagus irregularis]|nr:unnamed protein product [Rhizophagus irregularis]
MRPHFPFSNYLAGVSGGGKTSTAFGVAMQHCFKDYDTLTIINIINDCLKVNYLTLIFDEAQVLCRRDYGEYKKSSGEKRNLLQAYTEHLTHLPVTCLIPGTYMHMASALVLGKFQGIKEEVFSWKKEERLEIGLGKIPANREDNSKVEEEEYGQDSNYDDLNYDLNYIENTKGYQKSRWSSHIELTGKRPELFRINEYSDLVIIVDDRNMEYVFGPSG